MSRSIFGILVATLGIALAPTPAAAQFSSSVQGIVADQSGAVMPGVTVTARNLETQVAVTAVTNETGVYRLSSLAPGRYEVTGEISGFQPAKTEVRLETAQTAGVNLTLTVAGASEQVSVVGSSSEVFNPAETRVQTTIRTETLQELPLQGRNFLGLVHSGRASPVMAPSAAGRRPTHRTTSRPRRPSRPAGTAAIRAATSSRSTG